MGKSKSEIMKERWASHEYRMRQSLRLKKEWSDPSKRKHRLSKQAEAYKNPETNTGGSFRNSESAKHARSFVNHQNLTVANRRNAELRRGVEIKSGTGMKGPENHASKFWKVISPCGIVMEFRNLNHFVRENPHLFDPPDLKWVGSSCRATKGIAGLFEKNTKSVSWKGWTAIKNWQPSDNPSSKRAKGVKNMKGESDL